MTQLGLFDPRPPSIIERLAQAGRVRIARGLINEWGRECSEGPRKQLTDAQRRASAEFEGVPPGADNAGTLG